MTDMNPLINKAFISIELGFSVAFYSSMALRSVYYFLLGTDRFFSHGGMVSSSSIKMYDNIFWLFLRGS